MNKEQAIEIIETHSENISSSSLVGRALDIAIDALKAQLSQEGTTSDLISRTETVEHLRRVLEATVPNTDYDEGYIDGIEFGISTVSTMPTIQSQSTAQSTDLIDRRAAIDAVNNAFDRETLLTRFVRSIAVRAIRDMPPAQPESNCLGCKHVGMWEDEVEYGYPSPCTRCKRRANDNYEQ